MEEGEVRHGAEPEYEAEEAPLNLSAGKPDETEEEEAGGRESGGPSGLRVLGRELLQNPDAAIAAKDSTAASLMSAGGGGFPLPGSHFGLPPHFLFPFSGMPGSPGESDQGFTPPASQGGKSQIFNIEAYCKLCNKEFCNKYFLKTHMANKHGIYSGEGAASGGGQRSDSHHPSSNNGPPGLFDTTGQRLRLPASSIMSSMVSLPSTPVSISGSFMAMASSASSAARNGSSPHPGSEDDSGRKSVDGGGDGVSPRSQDASPARMSPKQGPPPLISSDESPPHSAGNADGDTHTAAAANGGEMNQPNETEQSELLRKSAAELGSFPPGLRLSMVPHMSPFGPLPFFNMPPMGPMDLVRKSEAEKRDMLGAGGLPTSLGSPRSGGGAGANSSGQADTAGGGGGGSGKGNMTPDKLRQMGVINADAFCEYCCKEFCNKYFLRVHKLKKHGVCSPELPPEKVQKILAQMAKEAGKTGQPMPPLTLGTPSAGAGGLIRPPSSLSESPKSLAAAHQQSPVAAGLSSSPLNLIRPPQLPNFLSLPPLDTPRGGDDTQSSSGSDRQDEREEGRPVSRQLHHHQQQLSPRSMIEPECELKIDEGAGSVLRSPLPDAQENAANNHLDAGDMAKTGDGVGSDQPPLVKASGGGKETSEGLANLQNMIMKLNSSKPKSAADLANNSSGASSTVCRRCNKDMENKYFLHAHMMNEHGILNVEDETTPPTTSSSSGVPPLSIALPQYPADLSKLAEPGLNIPCPIISSSTASSLHHAAAAAAAATNGGLPKLSEKPLDYPKSLFEQMQGLPRGASFLEQMKKDLGAKMDLGAMSPLKRPSLDRDPNKKPASLR